MHISEQLASVRPNAAASSSLLLLLPFLLLRNIRHGGESYKTKTTNRLFVQSEK
jgi:hypothetical protein